MNGNFTLGHAKVYPPTTQTTIPYLHGLRSFRDKNRDGTRIYTVACTPAEHRWVCAQLARRRARTTTRQRRAGKGVSGSKGKQNPDVDIL